jgi:hypothetical protein
MGWASRADVERWFTHHVPSREGIEDLIEIRAAAKQFALLIHEKTPACADQSAAIRSLREAVLWAIAAIVIPRPTAGQRGSEHDTGTEVAAQT